MDMENIPKNIECATFPNKVFGPHNFFLFLTRVHVIRNAV